MHNYKKLQIWNDAMEIATELHPLANKFPQNEIYSLTSQIRISTMSIASDIAEGSGRNTD